MMRLLNQLRAKSLAALMLAAATLPFGCATAPTYPPPAADKAQVVVKVTATPKAGVQAPRTEGQYDKESVEKGRRFTRVNYSKMDCIAVVVKGGRPSAAIEPPEYELRITSNGFDRDLALVTLGRMQTRTHPGMTGYWAVVSFSNSGEEALTLFGATQGLDKQVTFEGVVPAHGTATIMLEHEGLYDVYCDEDDTLFCQLLVTTSPFSRVCESGGEVFFDDLPTGSYDVEVYAPRLPVWRMKVNATAGKRETLYAEVTVNKLPKAK